MIPRFQNAALDAMFQKILQEKPSRADAIVWLQGDRLDRGEKVFQLYCQGYAPTIVIVGNSVLTGDASRQGQRDLPLLDLRDFLIDRGVLDEVIFTSENAMNTKDQACAILSMAVEKQWRSILIVVSPYHQLRAYLTFLKVREEVGSNLHIINQSATALAWDQRPAGRDLTAREILPEEEQKIFAYGLFPLLLFRRADKSDAQFLFDLRNDDEVRHQSFDSHPLIFSEHTEWLDGVLSDQNRALFILFDAVNEPIGQIRCDVLGEKGEIHLALVKAARGMGNGVLAITKGTELFFQLFATLHFIRARIKEENAASIRAFEKAGYLFQNKENGCVFLICTRPL